MARTDPQLVIRLPAVLKSKLKEKAKAERRTITAQATLLLEQALKTTTAAGEKPASTTPTAV